MPIKSNVTYNIQGDTFSMSFDAPANLTVAELKSYLANFAVGMSLETFSDDAWDQAVAEVNSGITNFRNLPNWATYTPTEAKDAVTNAVFSGQTKAQVNDYIDTTVTTLATARTALKLVAEAIIDLRTISSVMAQAIIFLRDIAIKKLS